MRVSRCRAFAASLASRLAWVAEVSALLSGQVAARTWSASGPPWFLAFESFFGESMAVGVGGVGGDVQVVGVAAAGHARRRGPSRLVPGPASRCAVFDGDALGAVHGGGVAGVDVLGDVGRGQQQRPVGWGSLAPVTVGGFTAGPVTVWGVTVGSVTAGWSPWWVGVTVRAPSGWTRVMVHRSPLRTCPPPGTA